MIWTGTTEVSNECPVTPSTVAETMLVPPVVSSAVVIEASMQAPTAVPGRAHSGCAVPMVATEVLELAHVASWVRLMNWVE